MIKKIKSIIAIKRYIFLFLINNSINLRNGIHIIYRNYSVKLFTKIPKSIKDDIRRRRAYDNSKLNNFLEFILPPHFVIIYSRNKRKRFFSDIMFLTAYSKKKLVDINNNKLLTFFYNKDKFENIIDNYNNLSKLSLNKTEFSDMQTVEPIINGDIFSNKSIDEKDKILSLLSHSYLKHLNNSNKLFLTKPEALNLLNSFFLRVEHNYIRNLYNEHKKDIVDSMIKLPMVLSHNDLHGRNILVENNIPIIIDLEDVDYNFVFYDFMFLIHAEVSDGFVDVADLYKKHNYLKEILVDYNYKNDLILWLIFLIFKSKKSSNDKITGFFRIITLFYNGEIIL